MRQCKVFAVSVAAATALMLGLGAAPGARAQTSPAQTAAVQTSTQEAARFVETMGSQAVTLLASTKGNRVGNRQAALRDLIRESFNLELTSQFVLGKFWHQATPEQRAEFQDLFTEYLVNNYVRRLATYKAETLAIVGSQLVGDRDVLVETRIESAEGAANPVWRVRANDTGQYKIIDVAVDGVSLALTQRREFAAVANSRGLEGLLLMLREKLAAQAKSTEWAPPREASHFSLLASMLASPNANRIGIILALK